MKKRGVIAAVWPDTKIDEVPDIYETIFLLGGTVSDIGDRVRLFENREVWVDIDFVEGLEKNMHGVSFLLGHGIHGIISTRLSLVLECERKRIPAVLRFFALDSHAVKNGLRHLSKVKRVEVLPASVLPKIITTFKTINPSMFIIAAGLISSEEEVRQLFQNGVDSVSIGEDLQKVWKEMQKK